ncbi:MAG: DUF4115 domain-containing protein, partial [Nodosilinea sp.]
YAEALGLDGQTISKEFQVTPVNILPTPELVKQASSNGATDGATGGATGGGAVGSTTIGNSTDQPDTRPSAGVVKQSFPTPVREQRSPLPLLLSLCALAVVLGLGAWSLFSRSTVTSETDTRELAPKTTSETTSDTPVSQPETADDESAAVEETSASQEAPVVVIASLSDRAWLSVVADGENVYEGTAESGFKKTWTAQDSVVLRTGNAGGVQLEVNGDRAVAMGEGGVVRTLTLTPDSGMDNVESP